MVRNSLNSILFVNSFGYNDFILKWNRYFLKLMFLFTNNLYESLRGLSEFKIHFVLKTSKKEWKYENFIIFKSLFSSSAIQKDPLDGILPIKKLSYRFNDWLADNRIRHIPVINENGMLGMVSIGDVVRAVVTEHREELNRLNAYIQGGY